MKDRHLIGEKGDIRWGFMPENQSWKKYDLKVNSTVSLNLLNG